jgi:hypothetical protein
VGEEGIGSNPLIGSHLLGAVVDQLGAANETFVYGPVSKGVGTLRVQALDGMVLDASVREGPPDTSMNFYVLVMPGSADVSSVLALDLAGNTLEELPVL